MELTLGLYGPVLTWFQSYLCDRSQYTSVVACSDHHPVRLVCGVPLSTGPNPVYNVYY